MNQVNQSRIFITADEQHDYDDTFEEFFEKYPWEAPKPNADKKSILEDIKLKNN